MVSIISEDSLFKRAVAEQRKGGGGVQLTRTGCSDLLSFLLTMIPLICFLYQTMWWTIACLEVP